MAILNQLRTTVSSYAIQEQKCVYTLVEVVMP